MCLRTSGCFMRSKSTRWKERTCIISFRLEPVKRLLCAVCTVSGHGVELLEIRVGTTSTWNLGSGKSDVGGRTGHVTFEAIHVVLDTQSEKNRQARWTIISAHFVHYHCLAVNGKLEPLMHIQSAFPYRMDPEKCTSASTLRTGRHPFRHSKIGKTGPYTGLIDAKHCKIFRLYCCHIFVVCNCQRTPFHIVNARGVKFGYRGPRTRVIGIVWVTDVTAIR